MATRRMIDTLFQERDTDPPPDRSHPLPVFLEPCELYGANIDPKGDQTFESHGLYVAFRLPRRVFEAENRIIAVRWQR
jgi:hypothetical protein